MSTTWVCKVCMDRGEDPLVRNESEEYLLELDVVDRAHSDRVRTRRVLTLCKAHGDEMGEWLEWVVTNSLRLSEFQRGFIELYSATRKEQRKRPEDLA